MQEINLYDLIKYYAKKWRIILIASLVGLLAGLIYTNSIQTPLYKSNSKLILVSPEASHTASKQTLINNYIDLITSRRVLEPVVAKQNNTKTYEELLDSVQVANQKDTAVIDITAISTSAQQSADIANEITNSFKSAVYDLYKDSGVVVVDSAVRASTPSNINKELQLALATATGFVLSLIVLFFIYDSRVNNPEKKQNRSVPRTSSRKLLSVKKTVKKPTTIESKNTKSNRQ